MIFQDPYNSVDPYWKVLRIVMEACGSKDKAEELLQLVGLSPQDGTSYPHELSGGQLQRVGIARALGSDPEFIVCDEPVSALDVSYQSKIITLLEQLQSQRGLTYMFISHDLAAVRHIADRIMIMYMGQIMEIGKTDEIISMPLHPYTRFLLSAVPAPFEKKETLTVRDDDEKSYGCPFASRCPFAREHCLQFKPQLQQITENHAVACFHPGK
ncbi:MAG: ABC transporter ATP-binding protein, partial [Erysipelotrichaceae bacterium]|nr:ABC transporter ATP-binding protein [Erysipelotrichaceae bacterium]